jgi:hypothetical protein
MIKNRETTVDYCSENRNFINTDFFLMIFVWDGLYLPTGWGIPARLSSLPDAKISLLFVIWTNIGVHTSERKEKQSCQVIHEDRVLRNIFKPNGCSVLRN